MIHVIATIEVAPGKRDEVLKAFAWVTPHVHAENGCIEYGTAIDVTTIVSPNQVQPRADVITVVEKWADLPALQAHSQAPHMNEYRQRVAGLVQKVTLQILDPK